MKTIFFTLFGALFLSVAVSANEEYVCNFGDDKRLISVAYESEHQQVPCQVLYDKGYGAEMLWNAQSEVGYCETRAEEFVERQESWGWSCSKVTQAEYVEDMQQSQMIEDNQDVQAALDQ